jgi:transcriptional regulator with XRE-family HTH domain
MPAKNIRRNHLYRLRRIRGLGQKHLAVLLGYRSPSMVSRFENGVALPPLPAALLLEMALGARLPEIYVDLHQTLEQLILKRADRLPKTLARSLHGRLLGRDSP